MKYRVSNNHETNISDELQMLTSWCIARSDQQALVQLWNYYLVLHHHMVTDGSKKLLENVGKYIII